MDECLFCDCSLLPGSDEHVFLSALGGRLITNKATCQTCNNSFANDQTGKIDDALAKGFEQVRNGLKIWSGRNGAPPTLVRAGTMSNGADFDLAPGFMPVMRAGKIPGEIIEGSQYALTARDAEDAKRILEILKKRGASYEVQDAVRIHEKVPPVHLKIHFEGTKVWRCIAKTAAVGCVVLYGNLQARALVCRDLRKAIRFGEPAIENYGGWDFFNEWPNVTSIIPHTKTPDAQPSGFEHSLIFADVADNFLSYVTLFGAWRFSVVLGPRSNLPIRGIAVNPRSARPARFVVSAEAPTHYSVRRMNSFQAEHTEVLTGIRDAFDRAMQQWIGESQAEYIEELAAELEVDLAQAGEDGDRRAAVIDEFARKLACIEWGEAWETSLETSFNGDDEIPDAIKAAP